MNARFLLSATAGVLALATLVASTTPAQAYRDDLRWRRHYWHERHWVPPHYYYRPYVYAPPPVTYAPPPYYRYGYGW